MQRRVDTTALATSSSPATQPVRQKVGAITSITDSRQFKAGDIVLWGPSPNPTLFNRGTMAVGEFKKGRYGQSTSTHASIIIGRKEGNVIRTGIMSPSSASDDKRTEIIIENLTEEEKRRADGPFMAHFAEVGEKEKSKTKSQGNTRKYHRDSVQTYAERSGLLGRAFQVARFKQDNEVQQSLIVKLLQDVMNQTKWTKDQYWSPKVAAKAPLFNPHVNEALKDTLPATRKAYICSGWIAERLDVTAIEYKASLINDQSNCQKEYKQAEELASSIQTEYKDAELLASKLVNFPQFATDSQKKADELKAQADELKLALDGLKIKVDRAQERLNMLAECSFQVGLKEFCMPATLEDKLYANSNIEFFSYPGSPLPNAPAIDQYDHIKQSIYRVLIRLTQKTDKENKFQVTLNTFTQAQLQIHAWNKKSEEKGTPLNSLEKAQILFALMKDTLNLNAAKPTTSYQLLLKAAKKIGLFERDLNAIQPLIDSVKNTPILLDTDHSIEAPFYELAKTLVRAEILRLEKIKKGDSPTQVKYHTIKSHSIRLDGYIKQESKLDLKDPTQNKQAAEIYLTVMLKDLKISRGLGLFETTSATNVSKGAKEFGILCSDSPTMDTLASQLFSTSKTPRAPS